MESPSKPSTALISTTRVVLEPLQSLLDAIQLQSEAYHILDEGLLKAKAAAGGINSDIVSSLERLVQNAASLGAERAVVTCSSLSPAVDMLSTEVKISVLPIDYPLYLRALQEASKALVILTNPTSEEPSRLMAAKSRDRVPGAAEPDFHLLEDAFHCLDAGDAQGHDRAVLTAIEKLESRYDVILLAQISIDRVKRMCSKRIAGKLRSSLDYLPDLIAGVYDNEIRR